MKAKVIETGEIVNVTPNPTWYKENGQGPDRREWDEDELEFEPGPKMVSLDKVCEWIKEHINEYHNPKCIADLLLINDLRKEFE